MFKFVVLRYVISGPILDWFFFMKWGLEQKRETRARDNDMPTRLTPVWRCRACLRWGLAFATQEMKPSPIC